MPTGKGIKIFYGLVFLVCLISHGIGAQAYELTGTSQSDYAKFQIAQARLWNGGADGLSGWEANLPDYGGLPKINLDANWKAEGFAAVSTISQARTIYSNIEAYRASVLLRDRAIQDKNQGAVQTYQENAQEFLSIAIKTTDFLLEEFHDSNNGGYFWMLGPYSMVLESQKQGYGQMHALFVLAQMYEISKEPRFLDAATAQFRLIQTRFKDTRFPGAVAPGFDRRFNRVIGVNNIDTFTHYFEALLVYWDIASGQERELAQVAIREAGNFLVSRLAQKDKANPNMGYVAYNYTQDWTPSQLPYSRGTQWSGALHASPGHTIELAFLLSRAVERGFPPSWLETATGFMEYCLHYAISPETGGMRHDTLDYSGRPLVGNPDNDFYIYWAQAETVRALVHFSRIRDPKYLVPARKAMNFMFSKVFDTRNGGTFPELLASTLEPSRSMKGDVWKSNYHEAMLLAELIRLSGSD